MVSHWSEMTSSLPCYTMYVVGRLRDDNRRQLMRQRYVIDDEYTASEGTKFPIKWASPEVILYTKFSSKSDIWAFGILTWEIYTGGKPPYQGISNTDVVQKVLNGYRLEKPHRCPDDMYQMVTKCWHTEPEHRPSFATVKKSVVEFIGEDYDETFE